MTGELWRSSERPYDSTYHISGISRHAAIPLSMSSASTTASAPAKPTPFILIASVALNAGLKPIISPFVTAIPMAGAKKVATVPPKTASVQARATSVSVPQHIDRGRNRSTSAAPAAVMTAAPQNVATMRDARARFVYTLPETLVSPRRATPMIESRKLVEAIAVMAMTEKKTDTMSTQGTARRNRTVQLRPVASSRSDSISGSAPS